MNILISKPFERLLIVISLVLVILSGISSFDQFKNRYQVSTLNKDWYYIEDGKNVPISLPVTIKKEEVTIYKVMDRLASNKVISTQGVQYNIEASIDDIIIYRTHLVDNVERNNLTLQQLRSTISLGKVLDGNILKLTYHSQNGKIVIPEIIIGSSESILRYHYNSVILRLIFIAVIYVIFAFSLIIYAFMKKSIHSNRRLLYLAWFLFLAATWNLTDLPLFQEISNIPSLVVFVSYIAFMAMPIPICRLVNEVIGENSVLVSFMSVLLYLNLLIQNLVHILFQVQFSKMIFVSHLLVLILIFVSLISIQDSKKFKEDRYLKILFIGFLILGILGVIAIIGYYLNFNIYPLAFEIGTTCVVISFIYVIMDEIVQKYKSVTQKEYSLKMQSIDNLSGLKNRRSYEDKVHQIADNASKYDNVLLIYFDIVNLKNINDRYGHKAGDQAVLYVSKCLERVFKFTDLVYRVGGNEFGVIIENPKEDKNYYYELVLKEIQLRQNYAVEIAKGAALLRNEDGEIKMVSDWKREADNELYRERLDKRAR